MLISSGRFITFKLYQSSINFKINPIFYAFKPGIQNVSYSRQFCLSLGSAKVKTNASEILFQKTKVFNHKLFLNEHFNISLRGFKISPRRHANPLIWVVIRPVIKLAAILTGRGFRKWWKNLPPNKRKYFLEVLKQNKLRIFGSMAALGLLVSYYYYSHLEPAPITGRKRFMAFDSKQFKLLAELQLEQTVAEHQNDFLPQKHPYTKRVGYVVHRLIQANKDIKELQGKSFEISVINSPMENAFVLPNGEIFVFSGMLQLCSNNDQLGSILAHEMSHCLLAHVAENFSLVHFVDLLMVGAIAVIWAVLPSDLVALITHFLTTELLKLLLHLPFSRKLETEADELGLALSAKACFDVRESSAFWSKMALLKKNIRDEPEVEFLSTHPSHVTRSAHLDSLMDEALKLRADCGCPRLKSSDPRDDIEKLTKIIENERRKYKFYDPVTFVVPTVPTK